MGAEVLGGLVGSYLGEAAGSSMLAGAGEGSLQAKMGQMLKDKGGSMGAAEGAKGRGSQVAAGKTPPGSTGITPPQQARTGFKGQGGPWDKAMETLGGLGMESGGQSTPQPEQYKKQAEQDLLLQIAEKMNRKGHMGHTSYRA